MGRYEDLVRLAIDLFNERGPGMFDDPEVLTLMRRWIDPEVESTAAGGVQGGVYHGLDGVARMVRDFADAWLGLRMEVEAAAETDDSVVARVRYRGRGRSSGAPIDEVYVWALRFREGKVAAYVIHRDREQARRIAGIKA